MSENEEGQLQDYSVKILRHRKHLDLYLRRQSQSQSQSLRPYHKYLTAQ